MTLVEEYIEKAYHYMKTYGSKTVLLMQVGTFYEIYSKKDEQSPLYTIIHDIGDVTGLVVTEKSIFIDDVPVLASGFRDYALDKWMSKMQKNGYTCVVYSQKGTGKNVSRLLSGIFTPGTSIHTEDEGHRNQTNNNTCIWIEKIKQQLHIGITNIDLVNGKSHIYEYAVQYSEIPTIYDEIERYICVYNPSETTVISNLSTSHLKSVVTYLNISSVQVNYINLDDSDHPNTQKAMRCETQKYQRELFMKYFTIHDWNTFAEQYRYCEIAIQAFCYLVNHLNLLNPALVDKLRYPLVDRLEDRLVLANHSAKQLNILSNDVEFTNKMSSVLNITNNTMTSMGSRKYRAQLLNPICNVETLNASYEETDKLLSNYHVVETIRNILRPVHDLEKHTRLIIMNRLPMKNLHHVYNDIKQIIQLYPDASKYIKYDHGTVYENAVEIRNFIEKNVHIEKCKHLYSLEENIFHRGVYTDLDEMDGQLHETEDILTTFVSFFDGKMNAQLQPKKSTSYLKLHETEKSGYSITITKSRQPTLENIIRNLNKSDNVIHIQYTSSYDNKPKTISLSTSIQIHKINNNLVVTSDAINKLCRENLALRNGIKELLQEKYQEFLSEMKSFSNIFYTLCDWIADMDIIQNRAYTAYSHHYCRPLAQNHDSSFLNAKALRHPIIEHINQDELYVANDINISCEENILLFGTNAVGKTSLIKSIGIAIVLAQSGMYVPASSFVYAPYHQLFTRILNCDNLFKGLSTFTLEMSEMSNIFRYGNKHSLVLGDELCSGTEVPSAICIFLAGLKDLVQKKCSFIFATHFHELLEYEELESLSTIRYKHLSIYYDKEKDAIVYDRKLRDGSGDKIYGLEVCKSLHLPETFMENAFVLMNKYFRKDETLSYGESNYNSSKIKGMCEVCKKRKGEHIHHLIYQQDTVDNYIESNNNVAHKNHAGNLSSVCSTCHDKIHGKNVRLLKKKTTKGFTLESIP